MHLLHGAIKFRSADFHFIINGSWNLTLSSVYVNFRKKKFVVILLSVADFLIDSAANCNNIHYLICCI